MFIVATDKGIGVANFDRLNGFDRVTITGNVQHSHHTVTHWMPLPEPPEQ
ncbi:DUF551 domain-containing protein [Pantoea sp. JGM49]|nr:DUF551 domain-containing protein [Pantoea sp. JGM49]